MPNAVNHSGFYDKHNCPLRDSIPGPRALQSGMLPLDHCDDWNNVIVFLLVFNAMSTLFIKLWDDFNLRGCVAPDGFENSVCGPWTKKFVHTRQIRLHRFLQHAISESHFCYNQNKFLATLIVYLVTSFWPVVCG